MDIIILNCYGIEVKRSTSDEGMIGTIRSNLKEPCPYCDTVTCRNDCDGAQGNIDNLVTDDELDLRVRANDLIDVVESMVLAHACAGIDIESPAYVEGIETTVDKLSNLIG
jgi:hypothetical protein